MLIHFNRDDQNVRFCRVFIDKIKLSIRLYALSYTAVYANHNSCLAGMSFFLIPSDQNEYFIEAIIFDDRIENCLLLWYLYVSKISNHLLNTIQKKIAFNQLNFSLPILIFLIIYLLNLMFRTIISSLVRRKWTLFFSFLLHFID